MARPDDIVGLEKHSKPDRAALSIQSKGNFLLLERLQDLEINGRLAKEVGLVAKVPVVNIDNKVRACSTSHRYLKVLVPRGMQGLLLGLRLVNLLLVQNKLAVGVREPVAIGGWQISSIEDIHAQCTLVVERFAGVQAHLDREVLQTDGDLAFLAMLVLEC